MPSSSKGGKMFEKSWTLLATIICLSNRGDRWVAKHNGKVILVDQNRDVKIGMVVPIKIYRESEKCDFGRIECSLIINGMYAFMPATFNYFCDEAIGKWAAEWKSKREEENRKANVQAAKYKEEQAERKKVVEKLLNLDSRRRASRYMTHIDKRSMSPLTVEEKALFISYFELPPWGIADHGSYIATDSYTD
jgi:hypothetical protein